VTLPMTSFLDTSAGQNHDRLVSDDSFKMSRILPTNSDGGGDSVDITAGQKMLSAMSGSLLTSVLGTLFVVVASGILIRITNAPVQVTPLDVIRVRLQSQNVPKPVVDFSKLAITTNTLNAIQATPNLGVTACCREVFFAHSNADYCLAVPKAGGAVAPAAAECAVEEVQKKTIGSTWDGFRKIARNEGVTSLWRGLSPTLVMAIPANIIYFTGYDWLRFNSKSPIAKTVKDGYAPLVAGSVARVLAVTAVSPIELFKTRLQAATGTSTSGHLAPTFRGVREMVSLHGYTSLWRGLTLTLWRDVPFSGIYWWGYESIRGKLTDMREAKRGRAFAKDNLGSRARRRSQSRENHKDTFVDSFTAGALSGAIASVVTTPFDVGKTRTQVYRDSTMASHAAIPEEGSMVRLLWHIFKTEGIPGLWKGWIPRTLKVAPACAIMISSYEVGKRAFRSINERASRQHDDLD
jgi:solute carrier family 25, member 39/40